MRIVPEGSALASASEIRIFDCPQRLAALLVVETSCVRQIEAARRALNEPHPDLPLKRGNAAADRRLGHAEQARGGGETAGLDDTSEHHDIVEIEHCIQCWDDVSQL